MLTIRLFCVVALLTALLIAVKKPLNKFLFEKGQSYNGKVVLHDIVHDYLPLVPAFQKTCDILCVALFTGITLLCLVTRRMDCLVFFVLSMLLLQYTTLLFFASTVLPDSKNGECTYTESASRTLKNMGSCNNLGISGHLMTVGLSLYVLSMMVNGKEWLLISIYALAFFLISASRNHYTLDCMTSTIVLALFISQKQNVIKVFHMLIGNNMLKRLL